LRLNEIGIISVEAQRPLFFDPYLKNRATGSFILIDAITNETVGAGMILQPQQTGARSGKVSSAEREAARGHAGLAIACRGVSGAGLDAGAALFDHGTRST